MPCIRPILLGLLTIPALASGLVSVVDSGAVRAFAVAPDTGPTAWAAVARSDDTLCLYRSDDFGASWQPWLRLGLSVAVTKLAVAVGRGESSFVYVFLLEGSNGGDLWLWRVALDTPFAELLPVAVGTDTIDDFSAALDRSTRYYLYCLYVNEHHTGRTGLFVRSDDFGRSWGPGTEFWNCWDPCLAYTAGSTIHCVWRYALTRNQIHYAYNRHYGAARYWSWYQVISQGHDQRWDPVVAQVDTNVESQAALWTFYTTARRETSCLDIENAASWTGGQGWTSGASLGSGCIDEAHCDIAADNTGPGGYVGLCYLSGDRRGGEPARVIWRTANSHDAFFWTSAAQVSTGPAAWEMQPRIIYVPGSPHRMPLIFYGGDSLGAVRGLYCARPGLGSAPDTGPVVPFAQTSPARSTFRLRLDCPSAGRYHIGLYNAAGQLLATPFSGWLGAGAHDITVRLPSSARSGTYFARTTGPDFLSSSRLLILP
jgi:hypothetical protein